jgi:hypothetical protein
MLCRVQALAGDFILVGTEQFRICAPPSVREVSYSMGVTTIPLCSVADSSVDAEFVGILPDPDLVNQPVFSSDTMIGLATATPAVAYLTTFTDFSDNFICGDTLQIGDTDQLYTTSVENCHLNYAPGTSGPGSPGRVYLDRTFRGLAELDEVPVWRRQTTAPLAWDITAQELKAAVEALTLVSTVDVSRVVHGNGYEWTITFTTVRANALLNAGALTPLVPNINTLTSDNPALPVATIAVFGANEVLVGGLRQGVPHYVTVAAQNGVGWGPATRSEPASETPVNQTPSAPTNVAIETVSNGEVLVQWSPPVNSGGAWAVTAPTPTPRLSH